MVYYKHYGAIMKKRVPTEQEIVKMHGVSLDYVNRQAEIGSMDWEEISR